MPSPLLPASGPYVALHYLQPLFDHLREQPVVRTAVLDALGLTPEQAEDGTLYVESRAEVIAFAVAAQHTGDAYIGLKVGQTAKPAHLGLLGHLLLACTRAQELFDLHMLYAPLVGDAVRPVYHHEGDRVVLTLHPRLPLPPLDIRPALEYCLVAWLTVGRWAAGDDFAPVRVELPYAAPTDPGPLMAFFDCPLVFDSPNICLHFDRERLDAAFLQGDPSIHHLIEAEVRRRLGEPGLLVTQGGDALLDRVRQTLAALLPQGFAELDAVAEALGRSRRSLQRDLDLRGRSFRELLDEVRRQLAERYVGGSTMTLLDVARQLGFAEQSAFQRAFKRWFDLTPGEYRRARGLDHAPVTRAESRHERIP